VREPSRTVSQPDLDGNKSRDHTPIMSEPSVACMCAAGSSVHAPADAPAVTLAVNRRLTKICLMRLDATSIARDSDVHGGILISAGLWSRSTTPVPGKRKTNLDGMLGYDWNFYGKQSFELKRSQ
jgi:hypothetical protein